MDSVLLDSGYYSTTAWGALNKCWKGFKIAKSEWDMNKMFHYAKGIRRLQRELKTSVSEFPQFGLVGRITSVEEEVDQVMHRHRTKLKTMNHKNKKKTPFGIEREPDLTEEQEEYFRRIRQEWIDPGSYE